MNCTLDERSLYLRRLMLDTMHAGGRGHLPSAFSATEILRVLYDSILRITPEHPMAQDRDRFILSKGHGCLALYAILADRNFFPKHELKSFCVFQSRLGGHPKRNSVPGVEASTGSLGHGLSLGVGMALSLRMRGSASRVFVLCGDGETNEGSIWEALLSASKHKLDNLCLIIDRNKMQSWDTTRSILPLEPYAEKFQAFGCASVETDGHDINALSESLNRLPLVPGKPSVLIAHTVKGKGIAKLEQNLAWHHKGKLTSEEYSSLAASLEYTS